MKTTLDPAIVDQLAAPLRAANLALAHTPSDQNNARQPVHTMYGGAQLFRSDAVSRISRNALASLRTYAPDAETLTRAIGLAPALGPEVYARIVAKLEAEPVEDYRVDFEDGYGRRSDHEEDGHAEQTGLEVAAGLRDHTLPRSIGIRIKPLDEESRARAIRTLDIFLSTLLAETGGTLPANFVVTLPKITGPEQVSYFVALLARLESSLGLANGALRFELMIETPRSLIAADGSIALPRLVQEGRGRITAVHFGAYDFTAALNVSAADQAMPHPLCQFARALMQVSLADTSIWLSDGATAVLPVPQHRGEISPAQHDQNTEIVHRAWHTHYEDVRASLRSGIYQSWDLHPAQLVTRYAANYAFFLEGLDAAATRLRNFTERAGQATSVAGIFDDAATGLGLLNFLRRAIDCGAVTPDEVAARTGVQL